MTNQVGAPGTTLSRRQFMKATGTAGVFGLAGCAAPTNTDPSETAEGTGTATAAQQSASLPQAAKPEVVDVTDQGNQVTLRAVTSSLPVHPGDAMGGPVELPRVWAWQGSTPTASARRGRTTASRRRRASP